VQKLYSNNKGTHTLSVTSAKENLTGQQNLYASAVLDKKSNEVILKIVNNNSEEFSTRLELNGSRKYGNARVISLTAAADATNTFENPENIVPKEASAKVNGKSLDVKLKPKSLTVIKLQAR
jgi:alpha-N-arabinofuranosidase